MEKDFIVSEIRRTAATNGGKPLGVARFEKETGIRETDWSGRYWVRWGDALAEAGFARNEFITAYPEQFLLQKLAELVRELQHFPLTREIKMKTRRDPTFPAEQAFRRLGGKSVWAAKLLAFCESRPDLGSLAAFCHPHIKSESVGETEDNKTKARMTGEVYMVRSGRYFKIGKTNSLGRRAYELALQLPEKATLVHAIKTDDPSGIEAYWHNRFAAQRVNGEWFELTPEHVTAFRWRKFM